jgi:acyl-CoA synthetase (AMP-forming)/AMP-acid ligase II
MRNSSKYFPLRTYSCLPLFHGTCLFTALCYTVGTSSTFCLGRKFSASTFSRSLVECKATRMLYVGELCRYLLKATPSSCDKTHKVIVAHGNGMQGDVWEKFKARFGIEEVREIYRSTEGVAKFDNIGSGAAGAGKVGFSGPISWPREQITYLVRYDPETEEPYRDPSSGFCVKVRAGEAGEAIGRVRSMDTYNDYLNNPNANKEKLIRDVFARGDLFQRTGDLLMRDKDGWIQFVDRTGDTFRWQGENVAAGEVRAFIGRLPNVHDVVIYGVKLEGYVNVDSLWKSITWY